MHSWTHRADIALKHKLQRSIDLCRSNLDYQVKYPAETRANPTNKLQLEPHPEAKKRIVREHEKFLRGSIVPAVVRPKRLSRVG